MELRLTRLSAKVVMRTIPEIKEFHSILWNFKPFLLAKFQKDFIVGLMYGPSEGEELKSLEEAKNREDVILTNVHFLTELRDDIDKLLSVVGADNFPQENEK